MPTLVFDIFPAHSHYFSSFGIARIAQAAGYRVVYMGLENYRETVTENGFQFYGVPRHALFPSDRDDLRKHGLVKTYRLQGKKGMRFGRLRKFLSASTEYLRAIRELAPSLILLDAQLVLKSPVLTANNFKVIILQTKVSTRPDKHIPPFNSAAAYSTSPWHNMLNWFHWKTVHWNRLAQLAAMHICYRRNSILTILQRYCLRHGMQTGGQLDFRNVFIVGNRQLTELLFIPPWFDFDRTSGPGQVNIGCIHDIGRQQPVNDLRYLYVKNTLLTEHKNRRKIYCSLGTVATFEKEKAICFLRKLFNVAAQMDQVCFIFVIDGGISPHEIGIPPRNAWLFKTVCQLDLLKVADIMLTHGGLNTIKECIYHEVPMLVYPLSRKWDQPGNGARVKRRGIGEAGNMQKDTVDQIAERIRKMILHLPAYKEAIRQAREIFYDRPDNTHEQLLLQTLSGVIHQP